jgi:hypothetical protein
MASQEIINTRKTEKKNHSSSKIKFDDSVWFDITKLSPNQIESEYPWILQNNKQ